MKTLEVVNLMINEFHLMEVGIDFMGYRITDRSLLSYHHLLVPQKEGGKTCIENGAILMRHAHDYLHIIREIDPQTYFYIRDQMIIENIKREIDMNCIKRINELLCGFEEKYSEETTKGGLILIKDIHKRRLLTEEESPPEPKQSNFIIL